MGFIRPGLGGSSAQDRPPHGRKTPAGRDLRAMGSEVWGRERRHPHPCPSPLKGEGRVRVIRIPARPRRPGVATPRRPVGAEDGDAPAGPMRKPPVPLGLQNLA